MVVVGRVVCSAHRLVALSIVTAWWGLAGAQSVTSRAEECIVGASAYHHVNVDVLRAIALHESRGRAVTVIGNSNGTIDVGLMGVNSVHFPELIRKGVPPGALLDECVAVYVGAWKYSQKIFKYGNNWQAIGAYHSETPRYSAIYQSLIYKQIMRAGGFRGQQLPVPVPVPVASVAAYSINPD